MNPNLETKLNAMKRELKVFDELLQPNKEPFPSLRQLVPLLASVADLIEELERTQCERAK